MTLAGQKKISILLDQSVDTQKTEAVFIPFDANYMAVFIPDLSDVNNPTVGIEVYNHGINDPRGIAAASLSPSADTDWVPVLDSAETYPHGEDAEICATTNDPAFVNITSLLGPLREHWIRFTVSAAEAADSTWWVVFKP